MVPRVSGFTSVVFKQYLRVHALLNLFCYSRALQVILAHTLSGGVAVMCLVECLPCLHSLS